MHPLNLVKLRNPLFRTDTYKFSHHDQVPENTTKMYSHLTPRNNKYLKRKFINMPEKAVVFGIQYYLMKLNQDWKENFFNVSWDRINEATLEVLAPHVGLTPKNMVRFKKLHDLGYLPLKFKALPEGTHVNLNIPVLTVTNTLPEFHWLTNFIEPDVLNNLYKPMTVATLSLELAKIRDRAIAETCPNTPNKDFMLHAFDFRGHPSGSVEASGAAYTLYTAGTDTILSIPTAQEYYLTKDAVAYSIPALEHSTATLGIQVYRKALEVYHSITEEELTEDKDAIAILAEKLGVSYKVASEGYLAAFVVSEYMMANGESQEQIELAIGETFNLVRLLLDVYPTGIFAYVSDSYSYRRLISVILPALKSVILNREGKIVIRPDSGDPVEIVCGIPSLVLNDEVDKEIISQPLNQIFKVQGKYYKLVRRPSLHAEMYLPFFQLVNSGFVQEVNLEKEPYTFSKVLAPFVKGSVETLWEIFGGTINESGYKQLDSHVGLVYGDGMTAERITQIYANLKTNGFACDNVCLAAGAYMLSSVTRDDLGFAIKASYAEVNGVGIPVYKQPETDMTKASAKGLFKVIKDEFGEYQLLSDVTPEEEETGELQVVFLDGHMKNMTTYEEIKSRVNSLI